MRSLGSKLTTGVSVGALVLLVTANPAHAAAPVAVDDTISAVAGTTFTLPAPGVLANDTDVPPGAGVHWQSAPPVGLTLASDGGISYVVPANAAGTYTFTYCVLDLPGSPLAVCISNLATVTVRVAGPHTVDDAYTVVAGRTFTVAAPGVLGNDQNIAPGAVAAWQTSPPTGLTLGTDGSITYDVPINASGTATFTYCVLDGPPSPSATCVSNLATVAITIATPHAVDDAYDVVPGTTFTLSAPGVLGNDTNLPDNPTVGWQSAPPSGLTLADDGGITYVVPADATGEATFTYCVLAWPHSPQAMCVSNLATVTLKAVTAPASSPATSSAPAPGGGGGGGGTLAKTGLPVILSGAAGVLLVVAGTIAILLVRRRRTAAA